MINKLLILLALASSVASAAAMNGNKESGFRTLAEDEVKIVDFAVRSHLVDGENAVITNGYFITGSYDAYCGLVKPSQLNYKIPFFMLFVSYGSGDVFDSAVNVQIPGGESEIDVVKKMCDQVGYHMSEYKLYE